MATLTFKTCVQNGFPQFKFVKTGKSKSKLDSIKGLRELAVVEGLIGLKYQRSSFGPSFKTTWTFQFETFM